MNRLSYEDTLKLIRFVEQRPSLYDRTQESESLELSVRELKKRFWTEIADDLQVDVDVCKTAWKSMRDQVKKNVKRQDVKDRKFLPKIHYKFYNELKFLVDYFRSSTEAPICSNPKEGLLYSIVEEGDDIDVAQKHNDLLNAQEFEDKCKSSLEPIKIKSQLLRSKNQYQNIAQNKSKSRISSILPYSDETGLEEPQNKRKHMEYLSAQNKKSDLSNEHVAVDYFFLNIASIVRQYNLNVSDLTKLQCKIFNFLNVELEKCVNK